MAFRDFKRQCKESEAKRQAERELQQREKHHSFQAPPPPPVQEDSPESQSYAEKTASDYLYKRIVEYFDKLVDDYNAEIRTDYQDFEMVNAVWGFYESLVRIGAKYCRGQGLLKINYESHVRLQELYKPPESTIRDYCKAVEKVCIEMFKKMPDWMQGLVPHLVLVFTYFW